jgi:hypothetical protein
MRGARPDRAVPRPAFYRSCRVLFHEPPDLRISTDLLTPEQVYELVIGSS